MKSLVNLFASELTKKLPDETDSITDSHDKGSMREVTTSSKTVKTLLQLNATPFVIDVNQYRNPHSGDNPTGDYKAAYKLKLLADAVPLIAADYTDSLQSTEKTWGNIVHYATSLSPYTQDLLSASKNDFENFRLSGMGGIPDDWRPVYARPFNWYDIVQDEANLIPLELDITAPDVNSSDFLTVDSSEEALAWKVSDSNTAKPVQLSMHPESQIKKITVNVLRVDFIRPWINYEILNLRNWRIDGIDKGYYSSGDLGDNDGIFPLITTSMLIGSGIFIEGRFTADDISVLAQSKSANNNLSIGSFLINSNEQPVEITRTATGDIQLISNIRQIVGYISNLVPLSPGI